MRSRSFRRAQREKRIRAQYVWMRDRNWYIRNNPTDENQRHVELMKTARQRHASPKCCSNWCCGNPRTHYGHDSLDEIRFSITCKEQLGDQND